MTIKRKNVRQVRHARVRARVTGTAARPRLSVFRSLRTTMVQLIDDTKGVTLCAASSKEVKDTTAAPDLKGQVATAFLTGKLLAERAVAKGVTLVVFDRGGYQYHGRVQAIADGARLGGLQF